MNINDYKITQDEYNTLTYNVTACKTKDILKTFPELTQIPEFAIPISIKDKNTVIKFIVLFYDKNTPLRKIEKESDRKVYAAMIAGFDYSIDTGLFAPEIDTILRCKDGPVNHMIIGYLRHISSVQYSTMVVGYEMFYQKLEVIMENKKKGAAAEAARGKMWEQAMKLKDNLEVMAEKLTSEKNPFLKEDLYRVVNVELNKNMMIFPEDRVLAKKTNG